LTPRRGAEYASRVNGADDGGGRMRLLHECCNAFAARLEIDELIPLVLTKCRDALGAEGIAVLLRDETRRDLSFAFLADRSPEMAMRLGAVRVPEGRGIAGAVLRDVRAERIDEAASDPRFFPDVDRISGMQTRALLCVPLVGPSGALGVLQVVNRRDGSAFTDEDLDLLDGLAAGVAIAIGNAQAHARVKGEELRLRTEVGALRRDLAQRDRFVEIIGSGPGMTEVFRLMDRAAVAQIPVLIEGETGTGKELVARAVHRASGRTGGAFVAINCAAFPETLLESELFGHRRGAFTGAFQDKRGLFEAASGGTLFLDEIGEMPAAMQAKLLRVLQEGEILPLGDVRPRSIDVRVISATNRDLEHEVESGRFRQDLFYRVATFPIRLPPLRERREDIPVLAARILRAVAERQGKRIVGASAAAVAALQRFDWPGNVRELENEIERAVALACDGDTLEPLHLSAKLAPNQPSAAASDAAPARYADVPLREARDAFEARHIGAALDHYAGNVTRAAQALGLSRSMLHKKMKEYGLRGAERTD
jgi:Nif-specific regulatory protein